MSIELSLLSRVGDEQEEQLRIISHTLMEGNIAADEDAETDNDITANR